MKIYKIQLIFIVFWILIGFNSCMVVKRNSLYHFMYGAFNGHYDGGYPQSLMDLYFIDNNDNPIKNIKLVVENSWPSERFCSWPVSNYCERTLLLSDSNGLISLYHIPRGHFEFSGRVLFDFIYLDQPNQRCEFYLNNRRVYRTDYFDLVRELDKKDTIQTEFTWPNDSTSIETFMYLKKTIKIK